MRVNNSIKNSAIAMLSNILIMVIGFVSQTIFVKTLGTEYLGINGLFTNIVSMLAIVELGIGPAIIYSLYGPLAEDNKEKVKSILKFYKKCYTIIALLIFAIGLCTMPFIKYFVDTNIEMSFSGVYGIFLLFIIDAALSYICSYKRSIIQADQKVRIINLIHGIVYFIMSVLQICFLLVKKDYFIYLIIKIVFRVIENVLINIYANHKYSYIKEKKVEDIDEKEKKSIFKKVKGLVFHKIGGFVVMGTDNILISKFVGIVEVGLYSNYYLIINSTATFISQIFTAITASVGNLLVKESKEKSYDIFKKIMFLNFWIYGFASAAMYVMMEPFVTIWLGSEYLLANSILIILVINFYMTGMRASIGTYKDAAGIYYEDRFVPIIESVLNIVFSIIFVELFGMVGIFIGTFMSSLIVVFYSLPYFVYKKVFNRNILEYYKLYLKYAFVAFVSVVLSHILFDFASERLMITSDIIQLIVAIITVILIPNIMYLILFVKTNEFKYFFDLLKTFLSKILRRRKEA